MDITSLHIRNGASIRSLIAGMSLALLLACGSGSSELDSAEIVTACENAALRQIKSPSTAKFSTGTLSDHMVQRFPDGRIVVRDWVDAQNSFGATVRTAIVCFMTARAPGAGSSAYADSTVSLDSIRLTER